MLGSTRGIATLVGVAVAGVLLWLATEVALGDELSSAEHWGYVVLIAAAGLVIAISHVAGGWTKWGRRRSRVPCFCSDSCRRWSPAAVFDTAGSPRAVAPMYDERAADEAITAEREDREGTREEALTQARGEALARNRD
jgi:hypothetical protein